MVSENILAPGSARALVTVENTALQYSLARKIARDGLTARRAEKMVKRTLLKPSNRSSHNELSPFLEAIREDIQRILGTEVRLKGDDGKGKIEIAYYSKEDLERIIETIKGSIFR